MRKRKPSLGSEVEVDEDTEEKMDIQENLRDDDSDEDMEDPNDDDVEDDEDENEDDDNENDDEVVAPSAAMNDNPFMDSFYGLASTNPKERANAAQIMLQHCLLGPTANTKDAAYAFRRLLNGVCSGRAAARQGNASALAAFVKVAFRLEGDSTSGGDGRSTNKMVDIREVAKSSSVGIDDTNDDEDDSNAATASSLLSYVRHRLLEATDHRHTTGKKRRSEERDYQFGRLFGILAIVRSNVLLPSRNSDDVNDIEDKKRTAAAFTSDLIELFWMKTWMREPAAHGISTMLKLFLDRSSNDGCREIASFLIQEAVIPNLLRLRVDNREEESDRMTLLSYYCAEQLGVALFIQSQGKPDALHDGLSFPLNEPILTVDAVEYVSNALAETSSVVHPRNHFVWDTLFCYLCREQKEHSKMDPSSRSQVWRLRECIPGGSDRVVDVIDRIVGTVVKKKLLYLEDESSAGKATHERRSLALCIVRNFAGATFVSSLNGPTKIQMDVETVESIVLTPEIVRSLFLKIIRAGDSKENAHLLKPLAVDILGSIIQSAIDSEGSLQRLAVAKALINSDVRFDAHTKTPAISDLLYFSESVVPTDDHCALWNSYLDFLESQFLQTCATMSDENGSVQAIGYVELLLSAAKGFLRSQPDEGHKPEIEEMVTRVLFILMATAFFDCSTMVKPSHQPEKSKKKKKKSPAKSKGPEAHPAVLSALKVHDTVEGSIAYRIRATASSKFFALASEYAMAASRQSENESDESKVEKDSNTVIALGRICDAWKEFENAGAKRYGTTRNSGDDQPPDDDDDDDSPDFMLASMRSHYADMDTNGNADDPMTESRRRLCCGAVALAMTVYLHRLSPGNSGDLEDDPDEDEEDDEEEICAVLENLHSIYESFEKTDIEDNPLLGMAEVCANLLSSPLGSGNLGRGAAPKLLRETVKYTWLGSLRLASAMATDETSLLDSSVVDILLQGVGASSHVDQRDEDDMEEDDDDDDDQSEMDDDDENDSSDGRIFSRASQMMIEDSDGDSESPTNETKVDGDDESDIEVDPSRLHDMLEEDSDADVDENILEHHEGADAALAKLIKIKQEARKAGQQAREAIEVANHLRCTFLLDVLLTRPDGWNRLFRPNVVLDMVLPWLNRRKAVSVLVQKSIENGTRPGMADKKALLEKLTSLMKQKLCKLRLTSMPFGSSVDRSQANDLVSHLTSEAMKSKDKEHVSACSSCMLFVFRTLPPSQETAATASSAYGQIVCDWSTKRTSGEALLNDLITSNPLLAQAALSTPLCQAVQDARSPFLKLQSYRLLTLLFSTKPGSGNSSSPEMVTISATKVHEAQTEFLTAVVASFSDDAMSSPKRVRVIFKAVEKFVPFLSNPIPAKSINDLKTSIEKVSNSGGNGDEGRAGLETVSKKLLQLIDDRIVELNSSSSEVGKEKSIEKTEEAETPAANLSSTTKTNKKKKKDKKKKKRR